MIRCLITGNKGFVGTHLTAELEKQGYDVFGLDLQNGEDIRDYETVRRVIDRVRPDKIFHLAAVAYVPESFIDPKRAIEVNTLGSLNILEAVRSLGLKTRIHLCGSSEEYGDIGDKTATTELTLPNPLSPYSIGKLGMDYLGMLYGRVYGMNIVITRTFNHTGPGRGEMYAESAFAKQIVEIELGVRSVLKHGDLTPIRNYTDVRDIVKAYALAIDLPNGVYNIASNQNITMSGILRLLKDRAACEIPTELNKHLIRPIEFSFKAPDSSKFRKMTDWTPKILLGETLHDLLNDWREKLTV